MKLIFDSVEECKQFLESINEVSAHECKCAEEPKKQTRTRKTAAKKTTAKKEDAPAEKEQPKGAVTPDTAAGPITMQNTVYQAQNMIADSNVNSKVDGLVPMHVFNETLAAFNVPAVPNLAEGDRQPFLDALRKGLYGE